MKNNTAKLLLSSVSLCLLCAAVSVRSLPAMGQSGGQASNASGSTSDSANPVPDDRFKADILLIVAHPDDEQGVTGFLARAMDEHKRVAVLWCTRGDTGANAVGWEKEEALGAEREIEARDAIGLLGITNVWFIGAPNTPSQDVLWSLERWNHGAALEEAVRIVRLTRPEVIISLLPAYYTGENHGDHQAAGVIATEAFDMAGDPTKFPEQIAAPSVRGTSIMGTEGLRPWQPDKIYYSGNPAGAFTEGQGPVYSLTDVSPSRHETYCKIHLESLAFHLTQGGGRAKTALDALNDGKTGEGKTTELCRPVHLILGKSLVGGSATGDVFEGVTTDAIAFAPVRGYQPETHSGLSIALGAQFAFYREFWAAHNVERVANLMPVQEMGVTPGGDLPMPLLLQNYTGNLASIDLSVDLPSGWTEQTGSGEYSVRARDEYPVQAILTAPPQGKVGEWQQITWHARSGGQEIGSVTVKVYLEAHPGMPQ